MTGTDRIIQWSTALAVLGVAAVAAVASYEHAYDLVRAHGEDARCGSRRPSCSPSNSRRTGCPRCARSALNSTLASPARSGYEATSPLELQGLSPKSYRVA
jgi:hypothetical protein